MSVIKRSIPVMLDEATYSLEVSDLRFTRPLHDFHSNYSKLTFVAWSDTFSSGSFYQYLPHTKGQQKL